MNNNSEDFQLGNSGFSCAYKNIYEIIKDRSGSVMTYLKDNNEKQYISYNDMSKRVEEWTENLDKYGFAHGDRAAVIAPAMPNTVTALLALALKNITAVVIDCKLPKEEINRLLKNSDVRGVFTVEEIYSDLTKENIENIPVFDLKCSDFRPVLFPGSPEKVCCEETADKQQDIITILFSSGTSSSMKGVMIKYDAILMGMRKQKYVFGLKPGEKYLITLPLNHISGYSSLMTFLLSGCEIGIVENLNASTLSKSLLEYNPHYFGMVPKVYDKIAEKITDTIHKKGKVVEGAVFSLIRLSGFFRRRFGVKLGRRMLKPIYSRAFGKNISGLAVMGSVCKPETTKLFLDFGLDWADLYGATETLAPITSTGIFDRYAYNSVGNIAQFDDISIKIHNPDKDGVGEIYVKTPMIMSGYFRDEKATLAAFDNGYFKTGDLGFVDKDNYLHITGRSKESIILHNGEKVSAGDVDNFYQTACPGVVIASCAITGSDGTDEIHIFIETNGKSKNDIDKAIESIKSKSLENNTIYRLAGIHTTEKIPVTSIGKVKRYLLKDTAKEQAVSDMPAETEFTENESVDEIVINIIKKHTKLVCDITPSSKLFDDLGLDSLEFFEIVSEITARTNVDTLNLSGNIQTVEDLIGAAKNTSEAVSEIDYSEFPHAKTEKDVKSLKRWIKRMRRFYNFEIRGSENIPKKENYILSSNHINNLDPIWLLAAMGEVDYSKISCLAELHLFQNKRTRGLFSMLGSIPVDRSGNTAPALKRCKECLNDGYSLIIFPEGARTKDGKMQPFKNGTALLSVETGKPIVPARIDGGYEIFPRKKKLPRFFNFKKMRKFTLSITFGKPIYPNGDDPQAITDKLRDAICELSSGGDLVENRN